MSTAMLNAYLAAALLGDDASSGGEDGSDYRKFFAARELERLFEEPQIEDTIDGKTMRRFTGGDPLVFLPVRRSLSKQDLHLEAVPTPRKPRECRFAEPASADKINGAMLMMFTGGDTIRIFPVKLGSAEEETSTPSAGGADHADNIDIFPEFQLEDEVPAPPDQASEALSYDPSHYRRMAGPGLRSKL